MAIETSTRLTYEDYVLLPNDGRRYEIIDGELYVNPSPVTKHQRLVRRLLVALDRYFEVHGGGEVFQAPHDVLLSRGNVVQPDIFVVLDARRQIVRSRNIVGAPDLIIEVLSDGTRKIDEKKKRTLYETSGVREYWTIDPDTDVLKIERLNGETFSRLAELTSGTITSPLLPGFSLEVARLFADLGAPE